MPEGPGEITLLLRRWRGGDKDAESRLFELMSPELHKIAGYCFRRERANHTYSRPRSSMRPSSGSPQ